MNAPLPPNLAADDIDAALRVQQAEQSRIAQLLHDTVSQSLTGAYLQAVVFARRSRQAEAGGTEELTRLADMLHQVIQELQAVIRELAIGAQKPSAASQELSTNKINAGTEHMLPENETLMPNDQLNV